MRRHIIARALIVSQRDDGAHVLVNEMRGVIAPFLPGGRVEVGEGVVRALERELLEELGQRCRVGAYLGAVEHQWPDDQPTDYEINHVFLVDCPDLTEPIVPVERDHHFFWCRSDQLAEYGLRPPVLPELIDDYFDGFPGPWWASTLE